jgi:hypothetical protein
MRLPDVAFCLTQPVRRLARVPMNQPDPQLALNCPECGEPIHYIATKLSPRTWYLYVCPQDGIFEVQKDGDHAVCYSTLVSERTVARR